MVSVGCAGHGPHPRGSVHAKGDVIRRLEDPCAARYDGASVSRPRPFFEHPRPGPARQYQGRVQGSRSEPPVPAILDVVVKSLEAEIKPRRVILFGSAARGELSEDSDLDLLVVMDALDGVRRQTARGYRAISHLGAPVDLILVTQADVDAWGDVVGHLINEALTDGSVLYEAA